MVKTWDNLTKKMAAKPVGAGAPPILSVHFIVRDGNRICKIIAVYARPDIGKMGEKY